MARRRERRSKHPLQELREALRLSQDEIANRIGRSRPFVVMVERRNSDLGRETVLRLVDEFRGDLNRLGITAEDLMRGSRDRPASGGNPGEGAAA